MYTLLQLTTLLYLLAVDRAFFESRWHLRYLPHALVVPVVLSHSLGILLLPLLFVPVLFARPLSFFPTRGHLLRFTGVGLAVGLACLAYQRSDFRGLGVVAPLPESFTPGGMPTFWLPEFPFWQVGEGLENLFALLAAVLLIGVAETWWRSRGGRLDPAQVLASVAVVATALHAFLVSAILAAVLLARYQVLNRLRRDKILAAKLVLVAALAVAWVVAALETRHDGQPLLIGQVYGSL